MPAGDPAAAAMPRLRLRDGSVAALRPIRESDEPLMAAFHGGLSPRSVYQRYFHIATLAQRTSQQRLATACRVDPAVGVALVAERRGDDRAIEIVAVGRLRRADPWGSAELAVLVADRLQGQGLGTAMTLALVEAARAMQLRRLYGDLFADNDAMHAVLRRAGFEVRAMPDDARVLRGEIDLR